MKTSPARSTIACLAIRSLVVLITVVLLAGPAARAADDNKDKDPDLEARKADAAELLKAMHIEQTLHDSIGRLEATLDRLITASTRGVPDAPAVQEKIRTEAREALHKDLNWESMEPEFAQAYAESFTDPELKDLLKFYNSPAGQKFVTKQPELSARLGQTNQAKVQAVMPPIVKRIREMAQAAKPVVSPSPGASTSPGESVVPPGPALRLVKPTPPGPAVSPAVSSETPGVSPAAPAAGKGEPGPP